MNKGHKMVSAVGSHDHPSRLSQQVFATFRGVIIPMTADVKTPKVEQLVHIIPEYLTIGGEQNHCAEKTHRMTQDAGPKPPLIKVEGIPCTIFSVLTQDGRFCLQV